MTDLPSIASVPLPIWLWNFAVLTGLFLAGIVWARLVAPRSSALTILLAAGPIALVVTMAIALVLASAGLLATRSFAVSVLVAAAAPLADRRVRTSLRRLVPRRPLRIAPAAGAVLVVAFVALWPSVTAGDEGLLPVGTTTWYYHRLAALVAAAGSFPVDLVEWGRLREFQVDYAAVTAHTAALFQLFRGHELLGLELYRVAVLAAAFAGLALFFRRWTNVVVAAIGAGLALNTTFLFTKFVAYKPETVAFVLAAVGLWLFDRFLVERGLRLALAVVAIGALIVLAHAEVFLVFAAFSGGLVVARSIGRTIRSRTTAVRLRANLARAAAIGCGGLLGGVLLHSLVAGELRLIGYAVTDVSAPEISPDVLPAGWTLSDDPTWNFFVAAAGPGQVGRPPPTRFTDPRLLPPSYLRLWSAVDVGALGGALVVGAIGAASVVGVRRLDRRRRVLVAWWLVAAAFVLAGSLLAAAISETYVPKRVGPRRLVPYEAIPLTAALISLLPVAWRLVGPAIRRATGRATARWVGLLLAAALAIGAFGTTSIRDPDDNAGITAVGWRALRWIDQELPADALLVSNLYADGSLTTLSGRRNLLDGRAGYLEDPAFLGETSEALLAARRFFQAPADPFAERFLGCYRIDYVLVVTDERFGDDLGGSRPFRTDLVELAAMPALRLVRDFEGRLLLYEVSGVPRVRAPCFG